MNRAARYRLCRLDFLVLAADRGRNEARSRLLSGLVMILAVASTAQLCHGQALLPEDFLGPRLVLNGQGHTASLQALVFSRDGKYLFSGGLDKVVHVWELREGRPRLDRSIRPPIRRTTGMVYALAISPVLDAQSQRLVAVAGHSVLGNAGQILVYRFPGRDDRPAGDLAFDLPDYIKTPNADLPQHTGVVLGLAFSADGRYLASCGEDKTVRIWDLADAEKKHPNIVVLGGPAGHVGAVRGVAFLDDRRLISAGGKDPGSTITDGTIRIWDWRATPPRVSFVPPRAEKGTQVTAMAVSPDGRQVVVGRENGELFRYDPDTGERSEWFNREELGAFRAIEALAFSPDGRFLAVSNLSEQPPAGVAPRTECTITLRAMPEGQTTRVVRTTRDLARALAFSPDGRFLAVGGGEAQEIALIDRRANPNAPALELRGPGTTLWDVGFVSAPANKPPTVTVAYARNRPRGQDQPTWEGFDLGDRRFVAVNQPEPANRALKTFDGWTVSTPGPFQITASRAQGNPVQIQLHPDDLRWWCYTFIPPDPAARHPRLTLAIGCQGGAVVIYSLPDGKRTRALGGHAGAIYAVAPSADGRWLATGSADQTVRLWSLAGCDTRAHLGARLERDATGNWIVTEVSIRSFAQQMGLKVGDPVSTVYEWKNRQRNRLQIDRLDAEIEAIDPGSASAIIIDRSRAEGPRLALLSTNRYDQPALSLLPASDREWIVWVPEGHYDTSIAGDRRLLGWHINKVNQDNPQIVVPLASEFYPMSRFEKLLHNPAVIDRLIQTGDVVAALGVARRVVEVGPPPTIRIIEPANVQAGAEITVRQPTLTLRVEAQGGSTSRGIKSIAVRNETATHPIPPFATAVAKADVTQEVKLRPGENKISIVATDDLGVKGIERIGVRLDLREPPPSPFQTPRLLIRSVGVESFDAKEIPSIDYAGNDASRLASFLRSPDQKMRFPENGTSKTVLNARSTSKDISEMFKSLSSQIRARTLRAGDSVFLALETHVVNRVPAGALLLGADANLKTPNEDVVPAGVISQCLEEVAAEGCLVFLLLDGIHDDLSIQAWREITNWVRDLNSRGVFVLVASKQEKSVRLKAKGRSAFVQAVEDSVTVAGGARPGVPLTLEEFATNVKLGVFALTSRTQFADLYPPDFLERPDRIRIFEPQSRPVENLAGK